MSDKYEVKYTIERYHQDVIELISLVGEYGIKQITRFQVQSATPSPWVLASSKKTS